MWHGASWNSMLWGVYYAMLLLIEKNRLLKIFEKMWKPLSFVLSHVYTIFITVFGFAIFYFDRDLLKNLGYLFGIGCSDVTDIFTNSVIMDNIILLAAAVILSAPVVPFVWNKLKNRELISYPAERILKTVTAAVFIAASTVRLVGNSYSAFLYFRF